MVISLEVIVPVVLIAISLASLAPVTASSCILAVAIALTAILSPVTLVFTIADAYT